MLASINSIQILVLMTLVMIASGVSAEMFDNNKNYNLTSSKTILSTSEGGDRLSTKENVTFTEGEAKGIIINVNPDNVKQTITGIGTSFTESSAFVLAHLSKEQRAEVMNNIYGEGGANFSLARTVIGSTDFSVEGRFSYNDVADDKALKHFSIAPDSDGFSKEKYNGIKDETFDVLPMIQQAYAIKSEQEDASLKIVASAWTAPPWMKDTHDWYTRGSKENGYQGTGGQLKNGYEQIYADYLVKYLNQYKEKGVNIWGLTPVNEPGGNNGQWESMNFTPESQNEFIKTYLGPTLHSSGNEEIKLYMFDHNRDGLEEWANVLYNDKDTAKYLTGAAVHWYESTFKVYEDSFETIHKKFPQFDIIHSEGTIDDLGKDAPPGIGDPERYKESNWFDNDDFWWNDNATDWAYTAPWEGVVVEDHPIYTPVHRYARNIIVSLNHWMSGWIDWNIVLDAQGGPNHVGNFCGAPIMIDTEKSYVYYTPVFYVLSQFSRTIRPGDKAVETNTVLDTLEHDSLHASATINANNLLSVQILNTTKEPVTYQLQIGSQYTAVKIEANSLQTVQLQL